MHVEMPAPGQYRLPRVMSLCLLKGQNRSFSGMGFHAQCILSPMRVRRYFLITKQPLPPYTDAPNVCLWGKSPKQSHGEDLNKDECPSGESEG